MSKTPKKRSLGKQRFIDSSSFYTAGMIKISIQKYIERLLAFIELSNNHFVLALKYFERIIKRCNYKQSSISLHKLFFVCLLAADKFLEDDVFNNSYYSQVAGMKCADLFDLEMEFYEAIEFDLYVDEHEFEAFKKEISSYIGFEESHVQPDILKESFLQKVGTKCA